MALSLRAGVFPFGINAPGGVWVPDGQMSRMVYGRRLQLRPKNSPVGDQFHFQFHFRFHFQCFWCWFAVEFAERAWPYPYVLVYSHSVLDVFPCGMVCHGIRGKGMALSLRADIFPCGFRTFPHAVWFAMEFAERAWPYPYVLVYSHSV